MVQFRSVAVAVSTLAATFVFPGTVARAVAAAPSLPSGCSQAAVGGTVVCTISYTEDVTTFEVPAGVSAVGVTAWGGHGSATDQASFSVPGGRGALVSGTFPVSPGDSLAVTVGGDGHSSNGGFGYGLGGSSPVTGVGAGGGGSSAVSDGNVLLLVAGAGGGGGLSSSCLPLDDISLGGTGGDAGQGGAASAPCVVDPATGGAAGGAPGADGTTAPLDAFSGGGGGGGGFNGGLAGADSNPTPFSCCTGAGGGGGGTSHADGSGMDVSLTGLSDRSFGENGLVQISFDPPRPITQIAISPDPGSVSAGTGQDYAVIGYNADGASLSDVSGESTLSISPDGTCTATTCTPAEGGPHVVSAQDGALTATASLDVTTKPAFTSSGQATFMRLRPGTTTISASGAPEPTIARHGGARLPAGLTLTDHGDGTATIAGTPTGRPGTRAVTLIATSTSGIATQVLTVVVSPLPGACANRFAVPPGHNRVRGTPAGDRLVGGARNDTLLGYGGSDCLSGGPGRDGLFGDRGADLLKGGAGEDVLIGGPGRDAVRGGAGDDTVRVADGQRDVVTCGPGHDSVVADRKDVLHGCEHVRIPRTAN